MDFDKAKNLQNADLKRSYVDFNESQGSSRSLLVIVIFISIINGPLYVVHLTRFLSKVVSKFELAYSIVLTVIDAILLLILWTLWYLKMNRENKQPGFIAKKFRRWVPWLQMVLPVGTSVFYGLKLIGKELGGQCKSDFYFDSYSCYSRRQGLAVPDETVIMLVLLPICFYITLRDTGIGAVIVAWSVAAASLLYVGYEQNSYNLLPFFAVYTILSILILYDNQRQNLAMFLVAEKLRFSLSENERLADETHASELRHMIANVAHDLKTPLASFLSGIEFITQIIKDWDDKISVKRISSSICCSTNELCYNNNSHIETEVSSRNDNYLQENLRAITECLDSIRNTNSFMIMTINRCIDYTKASKGIVLVPKLETIAIQDVVNLPIKVMRDFKSRLEIQFLPMSEDICSHLITDSQWLQENLLCLLSNAVKYSNKGTVEVSVTLVSESVLPMRRWKHKDNSGDPNKKASSINSSNSSIRSNSSDGSNNSDNEILSRINAENINRHNVGLGGEGRKRDSSISRSRSSSQSFESTGRFHRLSNFISSGEYLSIRLVFAATSRVAPDSNHTNSSLNKAAAFNEHAKKTKEMFLRFVVQDTGIGLSEEAMKNLFNPFKQAQRLAGGTGLGLFSLAKRIEALNGYYGVRKRSDGQQGSVFWFAIPYRPDLVFSQQQQQHSPLEQRLGSYSGDSHLQQQQYEEQDTRKILSESVQSLDNVSPENSFHRSANSANGTENILETRKYSDGAAMDIHDTVTRAASSTTTTAAAATNISTSIDGQFRKSAKTSTGVEVLSLQLPVNRGINATSGEYTLNHTNSSKMTVRNSYNEISPIPATSELKSLNILIVDDSLPILKMTGMMLRRQGHTVEQAENGAEALEMILENMSDVGAPSAMILQLGLNGNGTNALTSTTASFTLSPVAAQLTSSRSGGGCGRSSDGGGARKRKYDVVLMDLQMPVMDGLEAVRRLREEESTHAAAECKDDAEWRLLSGSSNQRDNNNDKEGLASSGDGVTTMMMMRRFDSQITECGRISVNEQNISRSYTNDSNNLISSNCHIIETANTQSTVNWKNRQLVIGVSANSDHETMQEAMKAGFDAFIGKPFSIDAFYTVLKAQKNKFR